MDSGQSEPWAGLFSTDANLHTLNGRAHISESI